MQLASRVLAQQVCGSCARQYRFEKESTVLSFVTQFLVFDTRIAADHLGILVHNQCVWHAVVFHVCGGMQQWCSA